MSERTDRVLVERTVRSMRVLTVYAHPNPASFCHAVLERFTPGPADAGHESGVIDLYAIGFKPAAEPETIEGGVR